MYPQDSSSLDPDGRTGRETELARLIDRATSYFEMGELISVRPIQQGHEDLNLEIGTVRGRFVLKVFANHQYGDRTRSRQQSWIAQRLVSVTNAARSEGASTVQFLDGGRGALLDDAGLLAVAYCWIDGNTYFDEERPPSEAELNQVMATAAAIHRADSSPEPYEDLWAVPHLLTMYGKARPAIPPDEDRLIQDVIRHYNAIQWKELPVALVHGDITKANVLVRADGKISVLDFSVANSMPRAIDLAVIAANLLTDEREPSSVEARCGRVVEVYERWGDLAQIEIDVLPALVLSAMAMEYLGSRWRQLDLGDYSAETDFWIRAALEAISSELEALGPQ